MTRLRVCPRAESGSGASDRRGRSIEAEKTFRPILLYFMQARIRQGAEELARALVLHKPGDSHADLSAALENLATVAKSVAGALHDACQSSLRALSAVDQTGDEATCLDGIEQLVLLAGRVANGSSDGAGPEVYATDQGGQSVDQDLIELFLASAEESCQGMEHALLALESGMGIAEAAADLRRRAHTLKGECGIIGLEEAQAIFHAAETYLDGPCGSQLDPLYGLVDWTRKLLVCLRQGHRELPDGWRSMLANFEQPCELRGNAGSTSAAASSDLVAFDPQIFEDEALQDFLTEAQQHLQDAEAGLLTLEEKPDEAEPLNVVFRAFHTIKGVAGFMNLGPIVRLAHSTETLLDEGRKGRQLLTSAHVGLFLAANDTMGRLIGSLRGEPAPSVHEVSQLVGRLDAAIAGELSEAPPTQRAGLESVLGAIGVHTAEEMDAASSAPERTTRKLGEILIERTSLTLPDLEMALRRQEEEQQAGRSTKLGRMLVELGLVTEAELQAALAEQGQSGPVQGLLQTDSKVVPLESETVRKMRLDTTVMVATQRLDLLVDMVGELVIAQQMIHQDPTLQSLRSEVLERNLAQVNKITRDLQEASMSLRMVTFKSTFQKMSRLVRDVAAKSGKDVNFTASGADTEVDRTVVEKISDPLIHILRNAIDHGLETRDQRRQSGKSEKGNLTLRAFHKSGSIVIEVSDDGRGIPRDKILAKAVAVGLVSDLAKAQEWSDSEVFKLIFAPGFSTAEKVTDLSGRGVGMDVVRKNIEGMRGKVDIASTPGKGSTFTMRLPLTLAIIDGMVVRSGEERFVIPTLSIVESFRAQAGMLHRVLDEGELIEVRGRLIPVHSLAAAFGRSGSESNKRGQGVLIVLESGGDQLCVAVDAILGQQQVVIKNLGASLPAVSGVAGGAILGDGRVAVIVDVERLIHSQLSVLS